MHSRCYRWGCIIRLAARAHRPLASCPLVRQVVMATLMARGEAERTRAVGTCFLLEHTIIHVRIFGNSAEQNRVETQIICGDLLMVPRVVSHCVASTATVLPLEIFLERIYRSGSNELIIHEAIFGVYSQDHTPNYSKSWSTNAR